MPTVPAYDLPTQELASTQLNTFQAPGVQPMQDISGKQISEMGKATMSLGTQFQKLADEVRDANVKSGDTAFLGRVQDILYNKDSGYMWKKNKDAMDGTPKVYEEFDKAAADVRGTLSDPMEQQAFDMAVNRHKASFSQNVNRHAGEQTFNYRKTESEARAGSYNDAAIAAFGKPEFQTYLNTARSEVENLASMAGLGDEAKKAAIQKSSTYVYSNVVTNLMLNNKYAEARSVLDGAIKDGNMTQEAAIGLNRSLIAGFNKEEGKRIGQNIFSQRGPVGTDASEIITWVIDNNEGHKVVENDAGKGPSKYGINSAAYFGVDAKDLTEKQKEFVRNLTYDQAVDIYKKRYWDDMKIESLPPNMRAMAYDAAVNQGPDWTKKALAQAGNDPVKFLDLREARYRSTAEMPEKGQYLEGWLKRVNGFRAGLNGDTSVSGMLAQTNVIQNDEIRQLAQAEIKHLHAEKKAIEQADYSDNMNKAMDIAYARDGGYQDIPGPIWGKLKFEDQQKLINRPKADNADVVLDLSMHPEKMKKGIIEQYRPMLTESTYQRFFLLANGNDGEGKVIAASVDAQQLEDQLRKTMPELMGTPKEKKEKDAKVQLIATIERMIDAEQRAKGGKVLSQEEKIKIQQQALKPLKVNAINWYGGDDKMDKRFFQVEDPRNIDIPPAIRNKIISRFEKANPKIDPTPANILNAYLSMEDKTDLGPILNEITQ